MAADLNFRNSTLIAAGSRGRVETRLGRESKGVIVMPQDSYTAGETYLANTCGHCGAFVGDFHLFSQYTQPADMGEYQFQVYEI